MYYDVFKFNQKRNEFKFDESLETSMLVEEFNEFLVAETDAELVDAYVDFKYVIMGTEMKILGIVGIPDSYQVITWARGVEYMMFDILCDRFGDSVYEIVRKAKKIVADINALKISEVDENGKVKKQKNLPNATEQIERMISDIKRA